MSAVTHAERERIGNAYGAAKAAYAAAIRARTVEGWQAAIDAYEAYAAELRNGIGTRYGDIVHVEAVIRHARRKRAECALVGTPY